MADDYTPRYQGDTSDPLQCTFTDHSGTAYAITGATNLTLKLQNIASGDVTVGQGTWSITDGPNGKANYQWAANDVANAGQYNLSVSMTLNDGTTKHFDDKPLEIKAL